MKISHSLAKDPECFPVTCTGYLPSRSIMQECLSVRLLKALLLQHPLIRSFHEHEVGYVVDSC